MLAPSTPYLDVIGHECASHQLSKRDHLSGIGRASWFIFSVNPSAARGSVAQLSLLTSPLIQRERPRLVDGWLRTEKGDAMAGMCMRRHDRLRPGWHPEGCEEPFRLSLGKKCGVFLPPVLSDSRVSATESHMPLLRQRAHPSVTNASGGSAPDR